MTAVAVAPAPKPTRIRRLPETLRTCGFCRGGLHRSCPGAVRTPQLLLLCDCTECERRIRCLDCGLDHPEDVSSKDWACLDRHGCAARVRARLQNSDLYRMLQQCKVSAVNTRRLRRRDIERILARVPAELMGDEYIDDILPPRPRRKRPPGTPRPTSGNCLCCGQPTKGGRFAVGHDAKLASQLLKLVKQGDVEAYDRMVELGWESKMGARTRGVKDGH